MNLLVIKILVFFLPAFLAARLHPFHVSTTDISYNVKEQKLEIICSVFPDDFEQGLSREYSVKADLSNKAMHQKMDLLVKRYMRDNLQVKVNTRIVSLTCLGFEQDKEAINVYLESAKIGPFKKIDVENSILLNDFPDEMNIVHITLNGVRKSTRLDYPEHLVSQSF